MGRGLNTESPKSNVESHRSKGVAGRARPLLALLSALALAFLPACGGSGDAPARGSEEPASPTATQEQEPEAGPGETPAGPEPGGTPAEPAEAEDGPGGNEPAGPADAEPPPVEAPSGYRLRCAFPKGQRIVYQVRYVFESVRGEAVLEKVRVDGTRFLRCTGSRGEGWGVVRLEPTPVEKIVEGEAVERTSADEAEFLLVSAGGETIAGGRGGRERLLAGLEEPVFPAGEVREGEAWERERDFREGRFVFRYALAGSREVEGGSAVEIRVSASVPGGVPAGSLRLEKAASTILFDPERGVVVKAEGEAAFARGEGERKETSRGSFEIALFGRAPMGRAEGAEASAALDTYFSVFELIAEKRYSEAERRIDAFLDKTDEASYALLIDALRKKIPDPRQARPVGLLERERFDFGGLPWTRPKGPPIVLKGEGEMEPGKPRKLAIAGKPFPAFWWEKLHRGGAWEEVRGTLEGKVLLVHVWASWIPPCAASVERLSKLAGERKEDGVAILGITLDTERKNLEAFFKKHPVEHPTVWDGDNRAVETLGLPGAPAFFVVDRTGIVRFAEMGWFQDTPDRIERAVSEALR